MVQLGLMKTTFTIVLAKLIFRVNRLSGSGGSALPGLIAEKIQPDILKLLGKKNFTRGIVVITGTNGKTTTAKMVAAELQNAGVSYVHNQAGSNLTRGVVSTLIAEAGLTGKIKAELALLEVDEASFPAIMHSLSPSVVVVTNLFRDQLDRYGEVDGTAAILRNALKGYRGSLVLNADDPLVASLGTGHKTTEYFGVSDYNGPTLQHDHAIDVVKSPTSKQKLIYEKRYFGHIGIYKTADGSFKRPSLGLEAHQVTASGINGTKVDLLIDGEKLQLELSLPGLYNVYNGLAALGVARCLKLDISAAVGALAGVAAAFGRVEKINYLNRELLLLLIKNPTGFNQIIATFLKAGQSGPLLFIINDNFADGRDVSWLWDAALEDIADYEGPVFISGLRAYDMALRLKYAGIEQIMVEMDTEKALERAARSCQKGERVFVLPTYTAMLEARKILVKKTNTEEFWQ